MKKNIVLLGLFIVFAATQTLAKTLLDTYPSIVEKLLIFKSSNIKAFYGGPVDRSLGGVKWVMPFLLEDEQGNTRAVYEAAFVNCTLESAQDAPLLFVSVSDIDIKFKNQLTQDFTVFSALMAGNYEEDKFIVIRPVEVANVYYPDIFFSAENAVPLKQDIEKIADFLHNRTYATL